MTSRLLAGVLAVLLVVSPSLADKTPGPMTLDGPFGSFTERRPAPTKFRSEADRQRVIRKQFMTAMSGHYRLLVSELTRGNSAASVSRVSTEALAAMAARIAEAFIVESARPEGESGALAVIWAESERTKFNDRLVAFRSAAERLRDTVASGVPMDEALYGLRYHCIACHGTYRSR